MKSERETKRERRRKANSALRLELSTKSFVEKNSLAFNLHPKNQTFSKQKKLCKIFARYVNERVRCGLGRRGLSCESECMFSQTETATM